MLVIVKDGNAKVLQSLFNLKAAWRRNILEIDAAENGRYTPNGFDDLFGVLCIDTDGPGIDPGKLFKTTHLG